MFYNELFISTIKADSLSILVLHHTSAHGVLLRIFFYVVCTVGGVEVTLLTVEVIQTLFLTHFFCNFTHYLYFKISFRIVWFKE